MTRRPGAVLLCVLILAGCEASASTSPSGPATTSSPLSPTLSPVASPSITPPTASPAPSHIASPSPQPVGSALVWHKLGTIGTHIRDVVGFAGGYAAIGYDRRVWLSSDGRGWAAVDLPGEAIAEVPGGPLEPVVNAIVSNGTELLVVGWHEYGPCEPQPSGGDWTGGFSCPHEPKAWTSRDGRSWKASHDTGIAVDPGEFVSAWAVPTGGWDAAVGEWSGAALGLAGLWHSADGLSWTEMTEVGEAIGNDGVVGAASATGRRVVAINPDETRTIVLSLATGGAWSSRTLAGATLVRAALAPADPGHPWLLVGSVGGSIPCVPTVWAAVDGGNSWTERQLPLSDGSAVMVADRIAFAGGRYVVVGAFVDADFAAHETWVSDDAVRWTELPRVGPSQADHGPGLVTAGPVGFLGISAAAGLESSDVWQLR